MEEINDDVVRDKSSNIIRNKRKIIKHNQEN